MWSHYFGDALNYTGLDLNPLCKVYEGGPNRRIYQGSQDNQELLNQIIRERGPFDIVIDDGGHQNQQVKSEGRTVRRALINT